MTMELLGTSTLTTSGNAVRKASLYQYKSISGEERYMVLTEYMATDGSVTDCTNTFTKKEDAIRYANKATSF